MNRDIRFSIIDSETDLFWIRPDTSPRCQEPSKPMEYHLSGSFPGDLIRFMYLDLSQLETSAATIISQVQAFAKTHEAVYEKNALQEFNKLVELHPFFMITELEWQSRMLGVIPTAEDGAAAELPLERLTALAPRLRQIQQAGLELF